VDSEIFKNQNEDSYGLIEWFHHEKGSHKIIFFLILNVSKKQNVFIKNLDQIHFNFCLYLRSKGVYFVFSFSVTTSYNVWVVSWIKIIIFENSIYNKYYY